MGPREPPSQALTHTEQHFTWFDQFMEAIFPLYVVNFTFLGAGIPASRWELQLIFAAVIYYESASHTGKEAPVVSFFPPLAPLVHRLTGSDADLIKYHSVHHARYRCNYSISPWVDRIMGSYRIDFPTDGSDAKGQQFAE